MAAPVRIFISIRPSTSGQGGACGPPDERLRRRRAPQHRQFGARRARRAQGDRPRHPGRFPDDIPLAGRPGPGRLGRLARSFAGFDLLLSYNWGAIDAVMARRMFGGPPLIHHEDGFNEDEIARQNPARVVWRRIALPAAHRLIVPSQVLENIAGSNWRQPPGRIIRIANGIDVERFAGRPDNDAIPGFRRAPDEIVVGTLAGLRAVKNLPRLVRAFAAAARSTDRPMRLVIVGEGAERARILATASEEGIADRLLLAGLSGRSGTLCRPFRHLRPVVGQRAGADLAGRGDGSGLAGGGHCGRRCRRDGLVGNSSFIVRADDEGRFAQAIARVASADALRVRLGRCEPTPRWRTFPRRGDDRRLSRGLLCGPGR